MTHERSKPALIYLDQAATSHPKPPEVVQAVSGFLTQVGASPGRSAHRLSVQAARLVFEARENLAKLLGVSDSRQIVFTANATSALNLALWGMLGYRDHVVTTSMEHNSVVRPLRRLQSHRKLQVSVVKADTHGRIEPQAVRNAVGPRTRLVVINHASNVVGSIQPIDNIKEAIGDIPLLVDAAQTAGCLPIQVERDGIDLLAFSGHKSLLGPQGTGGLYIHPRIDLPPMFQGGTGSSSESDQQPEFLPDRHESGTPNTCGIVGLGAGAGWLLKNDLEQLRVREIQRLGAFLEKLQSIPNLEMFGPNNPEDRVATVSINIKGKTPSQVGRFLDQRYGILVRVGLHCAPDAHRTLGTFPYGTVRLSAGVLNCQQDFDKAIQALYEIAKVST